MSQEAEEPIAEPQDGIADRYVGEILAAAADKGFRSLDLFVTWFTAGTAAAVALAVANLPNLAGLISLAAVKAALPWLYFALLLALISKLFGVVVSTAAGAAEQIRRLRREAVAEGEALSADAFSQAMDRAKPWPMRCLDLGGGVPFGRKVLRTLMVSGLAAFLASGCVVVFWMVLLSPAQAR